MHNLSSSIEFVLVTNIFWFLSSVFCQCEGESWVVYKNEKCYKLLDPSANFLEAQKMCEGQFVKGDMEFPKLVSIVLQTEQEFVSELLFKRSNIQVGTGVWLSASRIGAGTFKWDNRKELTYNNWADGFPSHQNSGNNCVEMVSNVGKWRDSSCLASKRVICEKLQNWSFSDLQRAIIKNSQNTNSAVTNFMAEIEPLKLSAKVQNLLIPVGFIYAQLPFGSSPQDIWPTLKWQDISSQYSGRFFRVVGGNAPGFGSSQEDAFQGHEHTMNSPKYEPALTGGGNTFYYNSISNPTTGIVQKSGFGSPRYASETRPINYSMRIWKRIA